MKLTRNSGRVALALFIINIAIIFTAESSFCRQWDRNQAAKAYKQAQEQKEKLDQQSPSFQARALECARNFQKAYHSDPHYQYAGDAIYEEGLIYQQLGDIYGAIEHYKKAIQRFSFLLEDYENNNKCPDALSRMAIIYSQALKDESSAQKANQRLKTRYKISASSLTQKKTEILPKILPYATAASSQPQTITKPETAALATVQKILADASAGSIQAAIVLNTEATYRYERLANPSRVYFDITNARIKHGLERIIDVNSDELLKIRMSQKDPSTVRVVFDISPNSIYSVSELHDPFHIVIHFPHSKPAVSAEAAAPGRKQQTAEPPPAMSKTASADAEPGKKALSDAARITPKAAPSTSHGDRTMTRMLGLKINRIVLDPGHGGHDYGTIGPKGLAEKDLALSLAQELQKMLQEELGVEVILTRNDDTYIPLEERTSIANQNRADLFVSIHANASRNRSISGIETYYLDFAKTDAEREIAARENAASTESISNLESLIHKIARADKSAESRELASIMLNKLYAGSGRIFPAAKNRGVRSAPFVVLIGANMPSILVEVAFISNSRDERLLKKDNTRKMLAKALYSGIVNYMETLGSDPVTNQVILKK